ncbi:MAG: hypothetical protein JWN17_584 [Frankiales bacterium]|nr:hypothetical protein [Frankiales bacterium]
MPLRPLVESRSAVLLAWFSLRPKALLPVLVLALLLASSLLPPALGLLCLLPVLLLVAWLSYLSWPVLDPRARVLRCVVLVALTVLGALRL